VTDVIADLQRRIAWLERQQRMLLTELRYGHTDVGGICMDSRCLNGPPVPHMAEQPDGCPRLPEAT
jgi:hypothetical protein